MKEFKNNVRLFFTLMNPEIFAIFRIILDQKLERSSSPETVSQEVSSEIYSDVRKRDTQSNIRPVNEEKILVNYLAQKCYPPKYCFNNPSISVFHDALLK